MILTPEEKRAADARRAALESADGFDEQEFDALLKSGTYDLILLKLDQQKRADRRKRHQQREYVRQLIAKYPEGVPAEVIAQIRNILK